jgi:hypothetical protein
VRTPFDTEDSEAGDADSEQPGEPSTPEVSAPEPSGPEVSAPEPSVPEVSAPEPPSPDIDAADVDTGLRVLFWKLVFLYKFSILGTSLGILLLVFEPGSGAGPPLPVGGLALLGYTLYQTRRGKQRLDAGEFDSNEESDDQRGASGTATAESGARTTTEEEEG